MTTKKTFPKKSSNKLSILEGAFVGVALGVAAGLFLSSKKGKKMQKDVTQTAAEFYAYIAPKLKRMKRLGEKEYFVFVESAAKNFAKAKKLSAGELEILTADAKKVWKHLKKHAK